MSRVEFQVLQQFSEKCLTARTSGDVIAAFDPIMLSQGVEQWFVGSLGFINEWRGFGFDRTPPGWRARYLEADHASYDGVFRHAAAGGPKTTWAECRRQAQRNEDRRALQVFAEAAEFGLTDGLIMPIHGLGDLPAAVSFGGRDIDLSDDAQASLYVVGALAYETLRRLVEGIKPIPPTLTPQELRVLRWTAEGKSAATIGVILSLSTHTVQGHHKHIRAKYGVSTMMQVVVLAATDGNLRVASLS
jgi:LuxR family quorum sensing-dependent transcriptional regulator